MFSFCQRRNCHLKGIGCCICTETCFYTIQFNAVCNQFQTVTKLIFDERIRNICIRIQCNRKGKSSSFFIISTGTLICCKLTSICQFHGYLCSAAKINFKLFIRFYIVTIKLCPYRNPALRC